MRCISPINASFDNAGNITYSSKKAEHGLLPFAFECRKCLPCRLNTAREKAVRAVHESKMHQDNIFLTLTYDEKHLKSPKLQYIDFQLFMKSLREKVNRNITDKSLLKKITYMVTGEYGEKNKRPHWHACVFNYSPPDKKYKYTTELGYKVYESDIITKLWKRGTCDFGNLTMDSANYVARYAAKKLVHGNDQDHDYHPIHKTSSKRGIGYLWIKKHWKRTFEKGFVVLENGQPSRIPRYYVDYVKKNHPEAYREFIYKVQPKMIALAEEAARREEFEDLSNIYNRRRDARYPLTRSKVKLTILESKFKKLQEKLKI